NGRKEPPKTAKTTVPLSHRGQQPTAILLAYCPTMSKPIDTGVKNSVRGLTGIWDKVLRLDCPHCGSPHEMKVRDIFVIGEIASALLRGAPPLSAAGLSIPSGR